MSFTRRTTRSTGTFSDSLERLREQLSSAEAVVVGAGAGLSAAAGFAYAGERFQRYFSDFGAKYGFRDMYTGGFAPFETPEERWAYWSRYVYINRYLPPPEPVYEKLLSLVGEKDYFVLTTNVDHCFQRAGFDKTRLFYTQGDYGLFQCGGPCRQETYDNGAVIRAMVKAQGYAIGPDGALLPPPGAAPKMTVPPELVPRCPRCGRPMVMNLRVDGRFAEDEGWHAAAGRYDDFIRRHENTHILFLELGVGANTPGIIKYPFWRMTAENPKAFYACVNYGEAYAPREIQKQSICIDGDIGWILKGVLQNRISIASCTN